MTTKTFNEKLDEILAPFDDIAYRPNSNDFDIAKQAIIDLICETAEEEQEDAILQIDLAFNGDLVIMARINDTSRYMNISNKDMLALLKEQAWRQ